MSEKSLLEQWRKIAYDQTLSKDQLQNFWANYFQIEKEIYEQLLDDPDTEVKGTVKELAEKYGQSVDDHDRFPRRDQRQPCDCKSHRDDDRRHRGQPCI